MSLGEVHQWRNGHQPWCKPCRKVYDAAYHQRVRDRRRQQKRRRKQEFLAWYWAFKEGLVCTDCGRSYHHAAMAWDHLPGCVKVADVGDLVRHASKRLVLEEIEKCEPVCANCHAVRTFTRGRGVAQSG